MFDSRNFFFATFFFFYIFLDASKISYWKVLHKLNLWRHVPFARTTFSKAPVCLGDRQGEDEDEERLELGGCARIQGTTN
uniref:Uncharacterized protein n=1 Tax=Ixodes ricinus TaxID=34613 RepID=A0A6B0UD69_IXORI